MIISVVGPTGVGKTKISEKLSDVFKASIINCDAVQVYKELNIGSAKPKKNEMSNEEHYLFDVVSIVDEYNVYNYQTDLRDILNNNINKNHIIVGGTGLYLKAGLYNYNFKDKNNNELLYDSLFIGLTINRKILYERINKRVDEMFEEGLVNEVKSLLKFKDESRVLNSAIGYKELIKYFEGELTLEETKELIKKNSRKYAKRQFTWFNNKMNIKWFEVDLDNINNTVNDIIKYINNNS